MTAPVVTTEDRLARLRSILQGIKPGVFEQLVAALISEFLGVGIVVARSGFQHGGDGGPSGRNGRRFRIEAKRYSDGTTLDNRALLGEIKQAVWRDPALEAWFLITTQEASEQLETDFLRQEEDEGVPIIILDWRSSEFPALAALCTASPTVLETMAGVEAAELARALTDDAQGRVEALLRELGEWSLGFGKLKAKADLQLREIWQSPQYSVSALGQNAAGGAVSTTIRRRRVRDALDAWWNAGADNDSPAVVTGWEGAGKTWATLQWITGDIENQPIVLLVPSSTAATIQGVSKSSLNAFIGSLIAEVMETRDALHWQRRFERLLKRPVEEGPVLTLIFDGMNQEPGKPWPDILRVLQDPSFSGRIRVIAITRNLHFTERLGRLNNLFTRPKVIEVDNYDLDVGGELDQRLAMESLVRTDLHDDLIEMARTPRLFDLVVRLRDRFTETEHVTVHGLLLEYGHDTFGLRGGSHFSEDAWNSWLAQVARDRLEGIRSYDLARLGTTVDAPHLERTEVFCRLSDIVDGKLFERLPSGQLVLTQHLAAHALAAALLAHLADTKLVGTADLEVTLNIWLDPIAALDEKAEILRACVSMILGSGLENNREIGETLLFEWLRSQNLPESHLTELRLLSGRLCDPLLHVVARSTDPGLKAARLRAVNAIRAIPRTDMEALVSIVERGSQWLSVVSREVDLSDRRNDEQDKSRAKRLIYLVGADRDGEMIVLGRRIIFVERHLSGPEDTLPSLLEGFPLAAVLPVFEAAAVSMAIRQRDKLWDGLKWLCLFNDLDFVETAVAIKSGADKLALRQPESGVHVELGKRAAAILLWTSRDEQNEAEASEIFPPMDHPTYEDEYLSDPGNSMYSIEMRHTQSVLSNTDIPLWRRLHKINRYLPDPDFQVPDQFRADLISEWQGLEPAELDAQVGKLPLNHNWDRIVPALARFAPDLLATVVRRKLHGFASIPAEERYATAVNSLTYYLLVDEEAREAAGILRKSLPVENVSEDAYAKSRLLILESHGLPAVDIAIRIIDADLDSISMDFETIFPAMTESDVDTLIDLYRNHPGKKSNDLILLLSITRPQLSATAWAWLEQFAADPDCRARGIVFQILYNADASRTGRLLEGWKWGWSHDQNLWSNHYGSLALAEGNTAIPFDQYVSRLAPWLILRAANLRGGTAQDTEMGAAILSSIIRAPAAQVPDLGSDVTISAERRDRHPFILSISMRTDESFASLTSPRTSNSETRQEALNRATETAVARIAEARESGATLFLQDVRAEDFRPIIEQFPDTIDIWLEGMEGGSEDFKRRVRRAEGFYLALCDALLQHKSDQGAHLWRALGDILVTNFVGRAKIDLMVHMAFRVKNTPEEVRTEILDISKTNTDKGLFDLVLAATLNGEARWIDEVIQRDEQAVDLWRRQRAQKLRGFRAGNNLPIPDRWPDGPALNGKMIRDRNELEERQSEAFARYWWDRYWAVDSDEEAFAAWQLFCECADRRALTWMELTPDDTDAAIRIHPKRLAHVEQNLQDLKSKMEKAFKRSEEEFLGRDIFTGVGPWGKSR